jgi:hypothetical protein
VLTLTPGGLQRLGRDQVIFVSTLSVGAEPHRVYGPLLLNALDNFALCATGNGRCRFVFLICPSHKDALEIA